MGLSPEVHRYIIAGIFSIAGILHFIKPQFFVSIMPDYLSHHLLLVYISGAAEIAGAAGILWARTQYPAGWGLILLLLAVFPANINMAVEAVRESGYFSIYTLATIVRLPMQFIIIYWVYWACIR